MLARLSARAPAPPPIRTPDRGFAARPRLTALRAALIRAAKERRRPRWGEPAVFFFDPARQAELEAARPRIPNRFAELTAAINAELPDLLECAEVRRVARALGLKDAARPLAAHCPTARELADLLAVPDDEVFLVLDPARGAGVRLHLRGAHSVAQLHRLLPEKSPYQFFTPGALRPDGTLPGGFAGSEHWLWPTQPLARLPRVNGERVVLVGPATVRAALDVEPRFPTLKVECEVIETLNAFRATEDLSRLCGHPLPVQMPTDVPAVARAA